MDVKNLKLIARTEEDLRVVSAHLQDSIANISDIASLQKNKIFLMQLNRLSHNYLFLRFNSFSKSFFVNLYPQCCKT